MKQEKTFITTRQDFMRLCVGEEIYSESHRWSVVISQTGENIEGLFIKGVVYEGGKRLFGIHLKEYEVLQGNYRIPISIDHEMQDSLDNGSF